MTQAFNLALLANAVDTSGRLNVGTNATGVLPLANGGTGTTNTVNSVVAGSGISVSTSGTQVTITNTSSATGTVTSVATGNGLQGGTITTSGTLSVACPGFNTVGSYVMARYGPQNAGQTVSSNSNYAAGFNPGQVASGVFFFDEGATQADATNNLSGTWKWMAGSRSNVTAPMGIACRVS